MGPPGNRDERLFEELRNVVRVTRDREGPRSLLDSPDAIPGYELLEELHRGGQGIVYRALQTATGREVALKVLLRGRDASTRDRIRFEREVELVSRLRHPGIVTLHDSGVADERHYLVMEFVPGRRLDLYVQKVSPSLGEALRLFQRMAEAVAAAHRRGVIHRDLKPSNILVDDEGQPHILDFGIAKAVGGDEPRSITATGEFMGTLAYASPEQVKGDPADIDTRSDVYSLGVLLYELVTGRFPYEVTGTVFEIIENIRSRAPRAPRELRSEIDGDLETILNTALAKEPDERYASADALARDVANYLARQPIEARGRSTWYVLRKSVSRNRIPIALVALVVFFATIGAIMLVRERFRAERQEENATLVREILQDVLAAAAPQRMGSRATLLEVYDVASERIEIALDDAPDAQAAFHLTIGDTYRALLMWPEARKHLEKALARYRALEDAELEVARCLDVYGRVLTELDPPSALPALDEAMAIRREELGPDALEIGESKRSLANAYLGQYAEHETERARELLIGALAIFEARLGPESAEVAATKHDLAQVSLLDGEIEHGESLLQEALSLYDLGAPVDPRIVDTLASLSTIHRRLERFDSARELLDRAVALTSELYGAGRDVEMLRAYADIHFDEAEFETAERLTRQALVQELGRWAERRPEDAKRIASVQARLTHARERGEEPPYPEAFAILRECRGNGAFELATWANGIAFTMRPQGRTAATEPLLREVLNIRCRAFGMDCPIRVDTLILLADVLQQAERFEDSEPLLVEVRATVERTGRTDTHSARKAEELMECCRTRGAGAE